jgi:AAA+ ATPase superfamily predicted ATPase
MENLINNEKSPMYRRKTSQMKIEELNYLDSIKFFPKYSTNLEKLNAYMTVGGIPYYLTVLSKYDSLKEGIINEFFNKDGTFFNEPTSFMNSEFDKPTLYNEIIRLIATGFCTYSDINSILNFGGGINPYINKLIELNIVAKKEPIAFTPKKKTIYEIVDTMFKF